MSKLDPRYRRAVGLEGSTASDRSSLWPRLAAVVLVILLIVAIDVYLFNPGIQRRAEYAVLRLQTRLKALRPNELLRNPLLLIFFVFITEFPFA